MRHPAWLTELFSLFAVTYKSLWTSALGDESLQKASDFVWFNALKEYEESIIVQAGFEAIKRFQYPPSIKEFLDIVKYFHDRAKDKIIFDQQLGLPSPPRPPLSRRALEAKLEMWQKLGNHAKAESVREELAKLGESHEQ